MIEAIIGEYLGDNAAYHQYDEYECHKLIPSEEEGPKKELSKEPRQPGPNQEYDWDYV